MNDYPHAAITGTGAANARYLGEQTTIPSHVVAIPGCGDVLFHHAVAVNVAVIQPAGEAGRIALMLAQEGCNCGCNARGRGLVLTPDPEGARHIAERLIAHADKMEAIALEQTNELLRKASGR